jgi:molybdate transport system ATP-binding protein
MIDFDAELTRNGFSLAIDIKFNAGITALYGPSGAGKSTVLNMLAGLVRPDRGRIALDGEALFDASLEIDVSTHLRRIGYVFQDSLLLPHLTVLGNLRYGQKPGSIALDEAVAFLGIGHLLTRRPHTLSGGERQRVAIGRALLSHPRLLLMDEPLASLDIDRKQEIIPYIERLNEVFGVPVVLVSHAADEVARLAQDVVVMRDGHVTAQGTPHAVLPYLKNRFEAVSILTATSAAYDSAFGISSCRHPAGMISVLGRVEGPAPISIQVKATDVTLALKEVRSLSSRTCLKGKIAIVEDNAGPLAMVDVRLTGGDMLSAALTRKSLAELKLAPGKPVWCLLKSASIDERWLPQTR